MKIIKILVKSCQLCLNYSQYDKYPDEDIDYCTETGKAIEDIDEIPEWCPLPNVSND